MANVNRFAPAVKAGKQTPKSKHKEAESDPVGALVRIPLYSAAVGLLVVYGWGALESLPMAVALALCAVFAMSELLKPKLGELAAQAMEAKDRLGTALMLGASAACIALGALGGVIAFGAANGPREAYDAAETRLTVTQTRLDEAQSRLDAVPTCTPDMPRVRCIEQTEQNAATRRDRIQTRDEAKQDRDGARAQLEALPNPGPGLPQVAMWQKALVIAAVEFVLFAVPFAARRRKTVKVSCEAQPSAEVKPTKPLKTNDGGWDRRRELYGPTGRKRRPMLVGAAGHA